MMVFVQEKNQPNQNAKMKIAKDAASLAINSTSFGIEIECLIPTASAPSMNYSHLSRSGNFRPGTCLENWNAKRDGSLHGESGYTAVEVVSPPLTGSAGITEVIAMLDYLHSIGTKVNQSCGLHVHVGIRQLTSTNPSEFAKTAANVAILSNLYAPALYGQTGDDRRINVSWARALTSSDRKEVADAKKDGRRPNLGIRYKIVNLDNLGSTGTVEFRCFAGTTNTLKILHHVWSALSICQLALELQNPRFTGVHHRSAAEVAVKNFHREMSGRAALEALKPYARKMKAYAIKKASQVDDRLAARGQTMSSCLPA